MAILKLKHKNVLSEGEGIDPKHFVSSVYISVAIKGSLLKFSMFSIHTNTISNMFLVFLTLKLLI